MKRVSACAKPVIGGHFRLQWEAAQGAHVLLYPEGMVKLNESAGEILTRCSGNSTVEEIIADLECAYGVSGLTEDVTHFVSYAIDQTWLEIRP